MEEELKNNISEVKTMKISEKIKEMQGDLGKYHVLEKNEEEYGLENMIMLILSDGGHLGPGKIIGESSEFLDFMFYKRQGPTFSLTIKKEHLCGFLYLFNDWSNFVVSMI